MQYPTDDELIEEIKSDLLTIFKKTVEAGGKINKRDRLKKERMESVQARRRLFHLVPKLGFEPLYHEAQLVLLDISNDFDQRPGLWR